MSALTDTRFISTARSHLRTWQIILLIVLVVLIILAIVLCKPPASGTFLAHPQSAQNYAESVQRIATMQAGEGALNPKCTTQFMTHGAKTDRVIVLIHGYTNCPAQMTQFGKLFYDRGYNVLIAPMPYHGLLDRMNNDQEKITAEMLTAYADRVVDIAQGLGRSVTVMGFSLGGIVGAWIGQNRSDVDRLVLASPALAFQAIPAGLEIPATNAYLLLPNSWRWWNNTDKEKLKPEHAYPRTSTRALAQILRLSYIVRTQTSITPPAAKSMLFIVNPTDDRIRNDVFLSLGDTWRSHGATVDLRTFDPSLHLEHDYYDPGRTWQRVDVLYPRLVEWIAGR